MNQNIITYLEQNKNKYSKEVLIEELKKAGYLEQDIIEGTSYIYGSGELNQSVSRIINFWDFKAKIEYQSSSQKWKDFLFGFFIPFAGVLVAWIPLIGLALFVFEIFSIVYLFNRRKFISFGLMGNFTFGILMAVMIIMTFFFIGGKNF